MAERRRSSVMFATRRRDSHRYGGIFYGRPQKHSVNWDCDDSLTLPTPTEPPQNRNVADLAEAFYLLLATVSFMADGKSGLSASLTASENCATLILRRPEFVTQ
jgi:hypothetical protein